MTPKLLILQLLTRPDGSDPMSRKIEGTDVCVGEMINFDPTSEVIQLLGCEYPAFVESLEVVTQKVEPHRFIQVSAKDHGPSTYLRELLEKGFSDSAVLAVALTHPPDPPGGGDDFSRERELGLAEVGNEVSGTWHLLLEMNSGSKSSTPLDEGDGWLGTGELSSWRGDQTKCERPTLNGIHDGSRGFSLWYISDREQVAERLGLS